MKRLTGGKAWTGAICVALISVSAAVNAAIDPKTIAGIWTFDEGKGGEAADASGRGNKAALMGDAKWIKGKFGNAVELPGQAQSFVSVPSSDSLQMKDAVTVMFWVRSDKKMVDMWGDRQVVVGKHYQEYEVGIYTAGQLHTYTSDGGANYDEGILTNIAGKLPTKDADWNVGTWYHIAWTLEGQHEIAYVNGVMIGEFDKAHVGTKPDVHPLEIGRRVGGGLPLTGAIDEVGVFNVALSAKDIQTAYERGIGVATGITAVEPSGKLAATWGAVKTR